MIGWTESCDWMTIWNTEPKSVIILVFYKLNYYNQEKEQTNMTFVKHTKLLIVTNVNCFNDFFHVLHKFSILVK
jgi:hypothetical protein